MSDLPKRVSISEEGPREGFQSEKKMIPVADKVRLIEALAETGLEHIACVSYVNPKRVPTMADAEEVARAIRQSPVSSTARCGSTSRDWSGRCVAPCTSTAACA
jgi:hydroxymethylglutaryl-CoA lyase